MIYGIKGRALIIPKAGGTLVHLPTPPQSADSGVFEKSWVKDRKEATLTLPNNIGFQPCD